MSPATARREELARYLLVGALTLLVLLVPAAIGLGAGEDAGTNIGNKLREWAGPLFVGIASIAGLYFLITRRFNEMMVWFGVALIVGVFVYAPRAVQDLATSLGRLISG
jgi:hypothetical protein